MAESIDPKQERGPAGKPADPLRFFAGFYAAGKSPSAGTPAGSGAPFPFVSDKID
jgi:hypothetical protein